MTPSIEYAPWHRFADWSDNGSFLPPEVLEKVNEEAFKKAFPKREALNDEIRKTTGADLKKTLKGHQGKQKMDTRNWRIWAASMKESRQENVYFIAGLPLQYWSFGGTPAQAGYSFGCEVPELWRFPNHSGLKALCSQKLGRDGIAPFEWLTEETAETFQLLEGLPTFSEWKKLRAGPHNPIHKEPEEDGELALHWKYLNYLKKKEQERIDGKDP